MADAKLVLIYRAIQQHLIDTVPDISAERCVMGAFTPGMIASGLVCSIVPGPQDSTLQDCDEVEAEFEFTLSVSARVDPVQNEQVLQLIQATSETLAAMEALYNGTDLFRSLEMSSPAIPGDEQLDEKYFIHAVAAGYSGVFVRTVGDIN